MVACQLLYFRQHGRLPAGHVDLDPDVIVYVADQIGVADDLSYSFYSDTARRQRAGIPDFLGFAGPLIVIAANSRNEWLNSLVGEI